MIETTAAGSLTESLIAAAIASLASPAVLWLALKGKLDDRYLTKEQHQEYAKAAKEDLNGMGGRQEAQLTLYNQMRSDIDAMRDRCTKMEARQDPVAEGVRRMEEKLDHYLNRQGEMEKDIAIHGEQLRTLFNQRGGKP